MAFSHRFEEALVYAHQLHAAKTQRHVDALHRTFARRMFIVIENGGNEDEAIAALLHDAIEDQGGPKTPKRFAAASGTTSPRLSMAVRTPINGPNRRGASARKITSHISHTLQNPCNSSHWPTSCTMHERSCKIIELL